MAGRFRVGGGSTPAKNNKNKPPRSGPEVAEGDINLNARNITECAEEVHSKKSGGGKGCTTLDRNKAYLDTCTSYHTLFAPEFLTDISDSPTVMKGRCNAGTTSTNRKGSYGRSRVWLNERGIANLLSVPMLEEAGYIVSLHTKKYWEVTTPEGVTITFRRDTGICKGMPYIDLREEKTGLAMIQTIRQNFEGFTEREVLQATLAREVLPRIGHPPDKKFKQIICAGKKQGLKIALLMSRMSLTLSLYMVPTGRY